MRARVTEDWLEHCGAYYRVFKSNRPLRWTRRANRQLLAVLINNERQKLVICHPRERLWRRLLVVVSAYTRHSVTGKISLIILEACCGVWNKHQLQHSEVSIPCGRCLYFLEHTHTRARARARTHARTHAYAQAHTHTHARTHARILTHKHTLTHARTHTNTHTHTHTTPPPPPPPPTTTTTTTTTNKVQHRMPVRGLG